MFRIGIDLGGTNIVAGVVDENYRILATSKCKTATPRPAQAILEDMARVAREAVQKAKLTMDDIESVGVGSPGICNTDTGVVERATNLGFMDVAMRDILTELLSKPVFIANDANAAAYGEYLAGAGKGKRSLVCITLGTGVGGGVIEDGRILAGHNFAGAELGHTVIVEGGELCSCGRRGCWETYASATGLIRQTRNAMLENRSSKLWQMAGGLDWVNGRTAFEAMRAGDETGKKVVEEYLDHLATGLVNMINIFQPEVLCIGGGISHEGRDLMEPLKKRVEQNQFGRFCDKKTLVCAAQLGNDAGIIGAAYLGA